MNQKTVIVTGSSRGIGREIALKFAKEGYCVVLNGKENKEALKKTKEELLKYAPCLDFLGDVGDYDFVKDMVQKTIERFGRVDVLVNNAGISYIGLLTDMSIHEWNHIIASNLTSVFNCCNLVLPYMNQNKYGKIINISSVWGNVGASCEVAYSASKGGINTFTKALAKEVAPSNIQVNAIACGAIDTEMNAFLSSDEKAALTLEIPANRLGDTTEVADFVFQVAISPSYLNGQIISFDGAWL